MFKYSSDLLWTAPEVLPSLKEKPKGTKEGDVYSFSIILHEIVYRMGAFAGHPSSTYEGEFAKMSCSCNVDKINYLLKFLIVIQKEIDKLIIMIAYLLNNICLCCSRK